jgi:hypothetical protein
LSVAFAIMVLRLHFRGHKHYRLPKIVKKFMLFKNLPENNLKCIVAYSHMNNCSILKNNLITKYKSKSLNIENELKIIRQILDTLKSIKRMQKKLKIEKKLEDAKEAKLIEWKEAARILDNVFFVFSFIAVTLTPICLFHQYLIEESPESFNKLTRCLNQ